jgi:hypothetical protein
LGNERYGSVRRRAPQRLPAGYSGCVKA